ncbi:hypothetical protein ACFQDG_19940, partial [Natronoarchaeum mannanilyticum]
AEAAAEHRAADRGEETTVGVNRSADTALYRLSSGRNGDSLDAVVDEVYETDAKRIVETELIDDGGRVDPPGTGPYWTKLDSSAEVASVTVSQSGGPTPDLPSGWDEYAAHAREIDRTVTASATWLHLNGSLRTTTETWTERYRVGVSVGGDPADSAFAPSGNVHRLYRPGGPAG